MRTGSIKYVHFVYMFKRGPLVSEGTISFTGELEIAVHEPLRGLIIECVPVARRICL